MHKYQYFPSLFLHLTIELAAPSYPCVPSENEGVGVVIAVLTPNPNAEDEMAIVDHSGDGRCIAAVTNESPGVPKTPPLLAKIYPHDQEVLH